MTKAPPNSKGSVSAVTALDRETTNRAVQLAFAFVAVILVTALAPL